MKIDTGQIKTKILPVLKKARVTRASIFGSYVRGDETEDSDVDLLVEVPKGIGLYGFMGLKCELEEVLSKKVDLVEYSAVKPRLKSYILENQIQII